MLKDAGPFWRWGGEPPDGRTGAPAVVGKHDEDEQHARARGGNREKIDGDEVPDVIGQERAPRLRWR